MSGSPQTPLVIDLTRLLSRIGKRFSGIDRVEFEYLRFLKEQGETYGLLRTRWGYLLIDQSGMQRLYPLIAPQWAGRSLAKWRVLAQLRFFAVTRARFSTLNKVLLRLFPNGFCYLNVGHSALSAPFFTTLRSAGCHEIRVMIHDVIPLSYSEYQRPETIVKFEKGFMAALEFADQIIVTTRSEKAQVVAAANKRNLRLPSLLQAPLGSDHFSPPNGDDGAESSSSPFVILGTIEPRKNHSLLLDIWSSPSRPNAELELVIVGARGWRNEEVFRRLDAGIDGVSERNGVSDAELVQLLRHSRALLFPSFAEGFGLPAVEAARMGVPIICSDIPVFRELLGDYATYIDPHDRDGWAEAIRLAETQESVTRSHFSATDWSSHFELVFKVS